MINFLVRNVLFEDLVKRAEELKAPPENAGEIIDEIKRRVKKTLPLPP